jgi:acyl carrier protein
MSNTIQPAAELARRSAVDVERRVIEVICEKSELKVTGVDRTTRFHELGDSLDRVEVVMKLEEEFELSIPDEDIMPLGTVGELVDYLFVRLQSR